MCVNAVDELCFYAVLFTIQINEQSTVIFINNFYSCTHRLRVFSKKIENIL